MKDALSKLFSNVTSSDVVKIVEIVCGTALCLCGVAIASNYDLSVGPNGLSCTKHEPQSNHDLACACKC